MAAPVGIPMPPPPPAPLSPATQQERAEAEREARRRQDRAVAKLRAELKAGKLAICVGSGVTLNSVPEVERRRLGWQGLVMNAIQYVEDQARGIAEDNKRDIQAARRLLQSYRVTEHDLFEAINRVTHVMKKRADLYPGWLRHAFEGLYDKVANVDLLDSLKALQRKGAMLLTTNYDDLLEKHCGLPSLCASDTDGLYSFQRKSLDAVFHPHGYWRDSDNVVLSAEHYYDVTRHEGVQETLRHILSTRTVLFVGCGGGLEDPNVGPLLRWIGAKHASRGAGHYLLLDRNTKNPVPSLSLNHVICETRADIATWLMRLLEPTERREGMVHEFPENRQRINISNWLSPVDQTWFLSDILDLERRPAIPFHQAVTGRDNFWDVPGNRLFRVTGDEGWGKTVFCSSVINSTRQVCRRRSPQPSRSRDSLAYFFCTTYDVHERLSPIQQYDFSAFASTVLEQICPPRKIHDAVRQLYTTCTQYHPARRPTNAELQDVLITIIDSLDREIVRPGQGNTKPGETYLILDGLDQLPRSYQDDYVRFLREIKARDFQHCHILLGSRDLPHIRNLPGQQPWNQVICDNVSVGDAMEEYVGQRILNEEDFWGVDPRPDAAERQRVVDRLVQAGNSFRWVYWKMQALRDLDPVDPNRNDAVINAPFNDGQGRIRKRARIT
ncbi:SIR2-like domain-containing protein [Hypoxylon sp. FL0890]|nr:SIR2-like domain-containing protein [Hypoxylon sp. FL0890]